MKFLASLLTFICIISANLFASVVPENDTPKKPVSSKSSSCTVTRTATGVTSIDCRGTIVTSPVVSQSCTVTSEIGCGDAFVKAQNCANANLGSLLAALRAQMEAACKDVP